MNYLENLKTDHLYMVKEYTHIQKRTDENLRFQYIFEPLPDTKESIYYGKVRYVIKGYLDEKENISLFKGSRFRELEDLGPKLNFEKKNPEYFI
jgi:hypothetical protein